MNATTRRAERAILLQKSDRYAFGPAACALRAVLQARLEDKARLLCRQYAHEFGAPEDAGPALLEAVRRAPVKHYVDGEILLPEGDPVHVLMVVLGGGVRLESEGQVIRRCREGDSFGEMALFAEATPSPRVVVEGGASILHVRRKELALLNRRAPIFKSILRALYREQLLNLLLPDSSALSVLGPDERHVLFGYFSVSLVSPGAEIVRAEVPANVMYVVASGEGVRGRGDEAEVFSVGSVINERELLLRTETADAVESQSPMILFALTWEAFDLVMEDFPAARAQVMARLEESGSAEETMAEVLPEPAEEPPASMEPEAPAAPAEVLPPLKLSALPETAIRALQAAAERELQEMEEEAAAEVIDPSEVEEIVEEPRPAPQAKRRRLLPPLPWGKKKA